MDTFAGKINCNFAKVCFHAYNILHTTYLKGQVDYAAIFLLHTFIDYLYLIKMKTIQRTVKGL